MLTIARKEQQSLIITAPNGEEIEVLIGHIQNDQIKICIEANKGYIVKRKELF